MASVPSSQQPLKDVPTFTIDTSNTSYLAITQKNLTPKRDQAILLDCAEGLTLIDYASAIGELVNNQNLLCASRISNNRVCIYVSSKEANQITENREYIVIND